MDKIKELEERIKILEREMQIEMNAKNKAYYFILSNGLFRRFANFCQNSNTTLDYHGAAVAKLYVK